MGAAAPAQKQANSQTVVSLSSLNSQVISLPFLGLLFDFEADSAPFLYPAPILLIGVVVILGGSGHLSFQG